MIRIAGVVTASTVLPVVENNIAGIRNSRVILIPFAELLEEPDHLATAAFCRDDIRHSGLDGTGRHKCCTPCVCVLHFIASRERLVVVVNINDFLMRTVRLFASDPCPCLCK